MRFVVECRFALLFAAVLTFASVMVLRQTQLNQTAHAELREAFIILHSRGHTNEAQRLYNRLLRDLQGISNRDLRDDFQRTLTLVDPGTQQPQNLLWKYHWTVSNELEKRSESSLARALEIAKPE
ncbi:MAG TPA: hypothetical protein VNU68_21780 [Verrucomicrobiae bacterium]|jgi:hypothetical protein|nr:hypothetical protein [Verrucomicrobiae bacterium]